MTKQTKKKMKAKPSTTAQCNECYRNGYKLGVSDTLDELREALIGVELSHEKWLERRIKKQ